MIYWSTWVLWSPGDKTILYNGFLEIPVCRKIYSFKYTVAPENEKAKIIYTYYSMYNDTYSQYHYCMIL
jgi:hypothetical protein